MINSSSSSDEMEAEFERSRVSVSFSANCTKGDILVVGNWLLSREPQPPMSDIMAYFQVNNYNYIYIAFSRIVNRQFKYNFRLVFAHLLRSYIVHDLHDMHLIAFKFILTRVIPQ